MSTTATKLAVTDHAISLNHVRDWDRDEGSYQLPHIYDYLLSAVSTPGGGQSF